MSEEKSFAGDWSQVFNEMIQWIQGQAINTNGKLFEVNVFISGSLLLAAERTGKDILGPFRSFRDTLGSRYAGCVKIMPDLEASSHRVQVVVRE